MRIWQIILLSLGILGGVGAGSYFVLIAPMQQHQQEQRMHTRSALASVCASLAQDGAHSGLCP